MANANVLVLLFRYNFILSKLTIYLLIGVSVLTVLKPVWMR